MLVERERSRKLLKLKIFSYWVKYVDQLTIGNSPAAVYYIWWNNSVGAGIQYLRYPINRKLKLALNNKGALVIDMLVHGRYCSCFYL